MMYKKCGIKILFVIKKASPKVIRAKNKLIFYKSVYGLHFYTENKWRDTVHTIVL